jgi:hypothetical protein
MKQGPKFYFSMAWAEIMVAAAVLVSALPVLGGKRIAPTGALSVDEWFLLSCAISSGFLFFVAVLTLAGNTMWKLLHFVVAGITAVMSVAFLMMVFRTRSPFQGAYLVPLAVAALIAGNLLKMKKCDCP